MRDSRYGLRAQPGTRVTSLSHMCKSHLVRQAEREGRSAPAGPAARRVPSGLSRFSYLHQAPDHPPAPAAAHCSVLGCAVAGARDVRPRATCVLQRRPPQTRTRFCRRAVCMLWPVSVTDPDRTRPVRLDRRRRSPTRDCRHATTSVSSQSCSQTQASVGERPSSRGPSQLAPRPDPQNVRIRRTSSIHRRNS